MSSVEKYPQDAYFLIAETAGTLELGSHVFPESGELQLAHLRVYHKKSGTYSYTMRLVVSSKEGGPELATSDTETFSDTTTGQTTDDWLGDLTFDFPDYSVLAGDSYFFRLVITGYTRSGDTTYLGVWCDWLEPIGNLNTAAGRIAMGLLR